MYLLMVPRKYSFMPQSDYDIVDKANPKMVILVNEELDAIIKEYGSGMYVYRPEAPDNLKKFFQGIQKIETYSRYGTNSIQGYNGTRADITFRDGRQVKDLYITSGNRSRSRTPKLYMQIEMQHGRATAVSTNGLELKGSPAEAKGVIREILKRLANFDKDEHKTNYFYPEPPKPQPAEEWEKVQ
jgi:hypothetical protein